MTRTSVPLIRRVHLKLDPRSYPPVRRAASATIGGVLTFFDYELLGVYRRVAGGRAAVYQADLS